MKKILSGLAFCACLSVGAGGASAADFTNEGGIDVDVLIALEETGSVLIDDTKNGNTARAAVAAGGGTFEVVWGQDRHTGYYNHPKLEHRVSVGNSSTTLRSEWMPKNKLASKWIKSSLWGNTANWNTK